MFFFWIHAKTKTDFSRKFYKNTAPVGMDKFKYILTSNQMEQFSHIREKKNSNIDENTLKNCLNIRFKLSNTKNIDNPSEKSQYEIYALMAEAKRDS